MFAPAYFDHNATTPLDPRVLAAMQPFLTVQYGNPSSRHEYGRAAKDAMDRARQQVAEAVGAHATEVIFTSGGTEANNLALKGAAACLPVGRLAVSAIEHPCVLAPAAQLTRQGWKLDLLPVDQDGVVLEPAFAEAMNAGPALVALMLANNETGALQPVAELALRAKAAGAILHCDAVQALGKVPVDFRELNAAGVSSLSISAHKIGGPKGAGALVLDKKVELEPLLVGGGHERGLRSGTENVAAIVGFGAACALLAERFAKNAALCRLRDELEAALLCDGAVVFGRGAERLPNTSYFSFQGIDGETLVGKLDRAGFAVASGAACSSAKPEPSHVLAAMGVPADLSRGAVRISLGPGTDAVQVRDLVQGIRSVRKELLGLASVAPALV